MKITLLPARELTSDMLDRAEKWRAAGAPELASPFFSVGFLRDVAAVRRDTWAAWIESDGEPAGLFSFHRKTGGRVGVPLGLHLSDYQGVVSASPLPLAAPALLAGCRLELFDFDHLLPGHVQAPHAPLVGGPSPIIEVKDGYEVLAVRLRAQSTSWTKVQQCRRRLEREMGPLRFEANTGDATVWAKLFEWKRGQFAATGVRDIFADRWTRELLERLRVRRDEGCQGACSALWAGEKLIAVHFGLRGLGMSHYWFPTYEPAVARHGPGLLLLDELVRDAAGSGDRYVDLGKGDHSYKRSWGTGAITVLAGTITRGGWVTGWRKARGATRAAIKGSPVGVWLRRWKNGPTSVSNPE